MGGSMRASLMLGAALLCGTAQADLFTAQTAYRKGDYERAFKDYRELAELGQPLAQHNLAIMYAQGQGVRQSDLNAYAWATLAVESGDVSAQSLAEQLRPLLAPGSEKIAADIRAPYSHAALDERLMPKGQDSGQDRARCWLAKAGELIYPRAARERGIQGEATVETTVLADRSTRNPRVISAVPPSVFEPTVRAMAMQLRWRPAEAAGAVVHCQLLFRFQMPYGKGAYPDLQSYVAATHKKAEAGDTQAELLYGLLLAGLPQLERPRSEAVPWFLKAAQAGLPVAQYLIGTSLLFGNGCRCEESQGEVWLRKAAEADQPSAQVELADYALRGASDARNIKLADVWLERAAASGDHDGTYYLSALLAATPAEELRDAKRALALLEKLREDERDNPTAVEIRAAALAASGAYGDAVKKERRAISMASSLSWDLAPLNERLARYEAGQPWYGNLLGL